MGHCPYGEIIRGMEGKKKKGISLQPGVIKEKRRARKITKGNALGGKRSDLRREEKRQMARTGTNLVRKEKDILNAVQNLAKNSRGENL